jgi:plastocyanin
VSQRAAWLAILAGSVERDHNAYANAFKYAGQGRASDLSVPKRSTLEKRINPTRNGQSRGIKKESRAMSAGATRTVKFRTTADRLIALVIFVICTGFPLSTMAAETHSDIVIRMLDMPLTFQPNLITIKVGQSVEWENAGNEVHHATSDPSLAIKPIEVTNPPGAEPFDSGFLRPGETFTHTFTVPGEYRYTCVVHEAKGMIGTIVVRK